MPEHWTVTDGIADIPEQILATAAAAQATLGEKLAVLRSLGEPIVGTVGPAAADRWISRSGTGPDAREGPHRTPVSGSDPTAAAIPDAVSAPAAPGSVSAGASDDPADLSAAALLEGYRSGAFDPVDAVAACLARIADADTSIGAVARLDDTAREQAARSAQRWRRGEAGPLEGIPIGVKDIIDTKGLATEAGSTLFAGHVPSTDAAVVARLREAGAVILAKTTTPEFAFGDESGDGVANPVAPGRWAGGSSSGSAAGLAAGLFPVALGSDTGGSIRVPASYCGVTGIKPTFGRVPRDGVFGVSWTLDHVGPMARAVEDLGLVLGVIAGGYEADPYASGKPVPGYDRPAQPIRGTRVGVVEGWMAEGCSPGADAALSGALARLEGLGCTVEPVPFRYAELAGIVAWVITVAEFAAHHVSNLHRISEFTPSAACRLAAGARTSASDYLKALRARSLVQSDIDDAFERVDVLITAATPTSAPDPATFFDDGDRLWLDKVARSFLPFNVTGQPALVMPAGLDEGRPAAMQIVAPPHGDALCLQIGAALQGALPIR